MTRINDHANYGEKDIDDYNDDDSVKKDDDDDDEEVIDDAAMSGLMENPNHPVEKLTALVLSFRETLRLCPGV